jgi:hypothetical protein
MEIIIRGKPSNFGKTRSEHEKNLRKEWGGTMTDEQLDKLKYAEKKYRESSGSKKNFFKGQDTDKIK